ncbi:hypothetical protein PFX98_17690 [Paucibacter sediminis]|uniref:Signal transduction histidine kinase internal region domain-containing protein n=1 Tax=Paucibacter sediminis TaxID=3019553 RepID=A0AA95NB19_9BURK|nr:hypothetical protein [Paucibacter sp. S2-9]WIT10734.1 hypothetical protein PFX98_17690 [Paucibacter sp. S2-9]
MKVRSLGFLGLSGGRAAGLGLLWGLAVTAMESSTLPLGRVSAGELAQFALHLLPQWCLAGLLLALGTALLEQRLGGAQTALAMFGFALLNCAVWRVFGQPLAYSLRESDDALLHVFWSSMFYGGLFVTAYGLSQRSERTRELLARAEIARQKTEAQLSALRLQALRGQIDPAFLLRAISEIERRYADDVEGAERLLVPLVEFLRAAMPGVRESASTVAAELRLAGLFAALLSELAPERSNWHIRVDGAMPDAAFPSLLLLPVLEQLLASDSLDAAVELRLHQVDGRCVLRLERERRGPPRHWLSPDLEYRMQVALQALHGIDWTLMVGESPQAPALLLTLPLRGPDESQGEQHE